MEWIKFLNYPMGASINYVEKKGGGRGRPNVNDTTKHTNEGSGGVKNPYNSVKLVYGFPL